MSLLVVKKHFTMLQINSSDYKAHQQRPFHSAVPIPSGILLKRKLNEHTRTQTQLFLPLPRRQLCQPDLDKKNKLPAFCSRTKKKNSQLNIINCKYDSILFND